MGIKISENINTALTLSLCASVGGLLSGIRTFEQYWYIAVVLTLSVTLVCILWELLAKVRIAEITTVLYSIAAINAGFALGSLIGFWIFVIYPVVAAIVIWENLFGARPFDLDNLLTRHPHNSEVNK